MNKRKFIVLISFFGALLSITSLQIIAQDTSNTIGHVSIASPTAASLGKFGDFPVSYNTGIPNINIPIYTVQSGTLSMPISLNYHASGLKVQEGAGWVGAGWALNAGGVITRTVVGGPDDRGVQAENLCYNGHYSDYGYNSYLFILRPGYIGDAPDSFWADDLSFCQGFKDGEPDLYFFNFGGYSGKFYFNDDRTPIFVPEEDFKVTPDLNNASGGLGFQGFIVTTPDGTKYYFGRTGNDNSSVDPVEITIVSNNTYGPANANTAVSSWFLNKIVSVDGMDSINFTYASESYSYFTSSSYPVSNIQSPDSSLINVGPNYGFNLVKNFVAGVRLTGITFPNGSVVFNHAASPRTDLSGGYPVNSGMYDASNTNSYALGSIVISNSNGFCKRDSLYTSYFHDNVNTLNGILSTYGAYNIQSDAYRLRLDSLQEVSCDATTKIPPYRFSYYSELVPRKLSLGIDHWGFYNGVTGNQGLIPSYSLITNAGAIVQSIPGANRDAAWPAMRGGTLQQITYPTGGFTQFTFQPNDTYVNFTQYINTYRTAMSCGWDGHNGSLGDGGDNPDTSNIHLSGNTYQFILANALGGGTGTLEIFDATTNSLVKNVGSATAGQTDTFYVALPVGNYWMELIKSPATSGHGISATINENVPVVTTGNDTIGGLRIQTITQNDGMTPNNIVTSYTYTTGGTQSSGILYSRPVYVQSIRNDMYGWIYQPIVGSPGCITNAATYYASPGSISPMSTMQGNHIGYNEVDVTQTGNGHSVYRYYGSGYWDNIIGDVCLRTINVNTCSTSIPNFPAPPQPFDPMRGELKYEGHFNQNGQILKDATYTPIYVNDPMVTPAMEYIDIPGLYSATAYSLQSAKKIQTNVVESMYDPTTSSFITTTSKIYNGSNYHHQPTRRVSSTSTNDSLATNTKYVFDFQIAACEAIQDSLQYFKNAINADTSHFFLTVDSCSSPDWICRTDTLAKMRRLGNLSRIQYLNYRLRWYSGAHNFRDSCYAAAKATADTLLKPILRLKDEFQNAPIEVSNWKDTNLLHASFIRYDTSISPLGFAYPGRTKLINLQAPSTSFTNASVSGSTIAKDSRYQDEAFYQFGAGNPLQVLGRDGLPNSYLWDYKNTEPIAKVVNATSDQIAYTSFEADGNGNWTITSSSRDATSSITGGSCYNLTNGNISKSGLTNGNTYVVSYWSKSGSNYTVTPSGTIKQGKTIFMNGQYWTYFEHTINLSGTTTISVSGSNGIDELRLYPSNAQMTTYTYAPLVGMTSSCDVDNRVSYFFYDPLGRLRYIKDQDGNIIKTTEYHYAGQ